MRIFIYFFLVFISYVKCLELESFYKYLDTDNNTSSSACDLQKSVFLQALFKQDSWALKSKNTLIIYIKITKVPANLEIH